MKSRFFTKFFLLLFLLIGCKDTTDDKKDSKNLIKLFLNSYFLQSLFLYPYYGDPSYVLYFQYNNVFYVGVKISDIKPYDIFYYLNNSSYTYTVSPELPAGLSLNATTGVISGTPTASKVITTYTIKVSNSK